MIKDGLFRIYPPRLLTPSSYLTADVAAAGVSLTLANNDGFLNNDPVLLEGFAQPLAEIKDATATPAAGSSLAVSAVTFAHGINTPVYRLPFDQIEISGTNTVGGTKTVIATIDINPTAQYTEYNIAGGTTYSYYYTRFYNSFASSPFFGDYSDEIAATDFGVRTVGAIRRMAFENLGVSFDGIFTPDWVYDQIFQCEIDVLKAKEVWGEMVELEYELGSITTGMPRIALPATIDTSKTNRGVLGVRIGVGINLDFLDWKGFQEDMTGVAYSTLATTATIGATSLVLTDSADFEDSGTVDIDESTYDYTTNTRSTNTLSGLTALAAQIDSGSHVWQNITFGEPEAFVVKDGYIYFNAPFASDLAGNTIWLDYYKTGVRPNSDGDTVSFSDPVLYVKYLEMAIKKRKAGGEIALTDESLLKYNELKKQLVSRDKPAYRTRMVPDVLRTRSTNNGRMM